MPIECRSTTYFIGDPDILSKTCKCKSFYTMIGAVTPVSAMVNYYECESTVHMNYAITPASAMKIEWRSNAGLGHEKMLRMKDDTNITILFYTQSTLFELQHYDC
jgi:hypothetical protein